MVENIKNELRNLIDAKFAAVVEMNEERENRASSLKNKLANAVGVAGAVLGVAGTAAAVVATGPFSLPAFIAGSRVLAAAAIGFGGISGATTARNYGRVFFDRIRGLNRQRISHQ